MPDLQEVFRMATQKVRPDPGALERQYRGQRKRTIQRKAGVYVLVAAVVVAGVLIGLTTLDRARDKKISGNRPSGAPTIGGLPPTHSRLAGIWLNDGGPSPGWETMLFRFSPDGTFAIDDQGYLDTAPAVLGTYELDGKTVTFTAGPGSRCGVEGSWAWRAAIPEQGRLHIVFISEDTTSNCPEVGIGTEWTFTRVSPASRATGRIEFPVPTGKAIPPPDESALQGIWFLRGSGALLRLSGDGTYAIDNMGRLDTAPSDIGTFQVNGGTITFTSGAKSRGCAKGDLWVWKGVELQGESLRGAVSEDECRKRAGGTTWPVRDVDARLLSGVLASG